MNQRAWVEVDLTQLKENLRNLAELTRPAQLCAVVKSEAYGHGMVPVAMALQDEDIWGVAVVTPAEGIKLREAGFQKPILVVGASFPEELEEPLPSLGGTSCSPCAKPCESAALAPAPRPGAAT